MAKKIFKILGILLLLFIIYFGRKYIIISKLEKARKEFLESNNYSCLIENFTGEKIEYKYKEGKSSELNIYNNDSDIDSVIWNDRNNNERIVYDDNEKKATLTNYGDSKLLFNWENILTNKLKKIFTCSIKTKKVDEKEFYVIKTIYGVYGIEYYFDKDTLLIAKIDMGSGNGVYYKNFEKDNVTDEDVSKPDVTQYEILDNRD